MISCGHILRSHSDDWRQQHAEAGSHDCVGLLKPGLLELSGLLPRVCLPLEACCQAEEQLHKGENFLLWQDGLNLTSICQALQPSLVSQSAAVPLQQTRVSQALQHHRVGLNQASLLGA